MSRSSFKRHPFSVFISTFLTCILISCASITTPVQDADPGSDDPIVAQISNDPIHLSSFLEEYSRTAVLESDTNADTAAAYLDFLNRYVDFRLKVLEAREAGYHQLKKLNDEIAGYRNQLARPYVLKSAVSDPIIELMHQRRQEMVNASHILLRTSPNSSPADTLMAYERLSAIRDSVLSGASFGEMAMRHSEDPSSRGAPGSPGYQGKLGFFGGGRMVDEFEDEGYRTPVGSVSQIFRTQFGYHILQVHDRQPLPGDIRMAHIMIRPAGPTKEDSTSALSTIQSVKNRIAGGEAFSEMAKEYSQDPGSASNGGELQRIQFDAGLPRNMRDAVYQLDPGDVSGVIETPFGFHLVTLLEKFAPETYEEAYERLSSTVATLPRAQKAEKAYSRQLRIDMQTRVDTVLVRSWLDSLGADSLLSRFAAGDDSDSAYEVPFAWMSDSTFTVAQFAAYTRSKRVPITQRTEEVFWENIESYLDEKALDYEIAALEERNAEFARTMNEFRDGLILFKLMEDSVWTAASLDSTGLEAFYARRADSYRYSDRTRILSFYHESDSLLSGLAVELENDTSLSDVLSRLAADTTNTIRVDTTMIESTSNTVYDQALVLDKGQVTAPIKTDVGMLLMYNDGVEAARQKTFEEARAQAVNEYQLVLEEKLITRLRKKYNVVLFPDEVISYLDHSR